MFLLILLIPLLYVYTLFGYCYEKKRIIKKENVKKILIVVSILILIYYLFLPNNFDDTYYYLFGADFKTIANNTYNSSSLNLFIFYNKLFLLSAIPMGILTLAFHKNRILKMLNIFYTPFVALINIFSVKYNLFALTGELSYKANFNTFANFIFLTINFNLILISIITLIDLIKARALKFTYKEINLFLFAIPFGILITLPFTTGLILFLYRSPKYLFKGLHFSLLFLILIITFVAGIILRKQTEENKKIILTWFSISAFIVFFDFFSFNSLKNLSNWPIHLCYTAIILFIIAIPFKIKTIFYFTYFVNVLGAVLAMLFPAFGSDTAFTAPISFHFWQLHYFDYFIPIVAVSSGYFKKPKIKETMYAITGFTVYFFLTAMLDTFLPTITNHNFFGNSGAGVDYFFLNGNVITNKIGIAGKLKDSYITKFKVKGVEAKVYYIYWISFYFFFVVLSFLTLYIYEYADKSKQIYKDLMSKYSNRFKERKKYLESGNQILIQNLKNEIKLSNLKLKNNSKLLKAKLQNDLNELKFNFQNNLKDKNYLNKVKEIKANYKLEINKFKKTNLVERILDMKNDIKASLKISKFYKKYPKADYYSVKNFNLEINEGEIFGFIGHNGAGKSTVIKAIVGLHSAEEGSISVCGYDIKFNPEIAKFLVGYVPDNHPLYERLTGYEYINYIANLYMVDNNTFKERITYYLKLFNLEKDINRYIKSYSHGMKQKISVIASLIHEPKVWILDEPLTGLDPTSVLMIKKCIQNHAAKGNIVFFSSHIIEVVENICTSVAIIKKGELMLTTKVSDAVKKYGNLTAVYKKFVLDEEVNE